VIDRSKHCRASSQYDWACNAIACPNAAQDYGERGLRRIMFHGLAVGSNRLVDVSLILQGGTQLK